MLMFIMISLYDFTTIQLKDKNSATSILRAVCGQYWPRQVKNILCIHLKPAGNVMGSSLAHYTSFRHSFHENRASSFSVILQTNKPTDKQH